MQEFAEYRKYVPQGTLFVKIKGFVFQKKNGFVLQEVSASAYPDFEGTLMDRSERKNPTWSHYRPPPSPRTQQINHYARQFSTMLMLNAQIFCIDPRHIYVPAIHPSEIRVSPADAKGLWDIYMYYPPQALCAVICLECTGQERGEHKTQLVKGQGP